MEMVSRIAIAVIAIIIIIAIIKIFATPLKLVFKILINTALGFLALIIVNLTSSFTGIVLGVNLINALIIGIFGVPGFALLLLIKWLLLTYFKGDK